ncbi:MAG TPA: SGNH/GDSL hydrolase family protein [Nitrospiraceae bacterium]|nr:SGNH/GDSL hydrolase family protein [Nitrospiraceae bacterium]
MAICLVLEVFLRVFNPIGFRVRGDKIILPSNTRYDVVNETVPKLDHKITHTKNSLGFRGEEPPKDWASYLTIIAVGGSTTECFYLSDGHAWTDLLARRLKQERPRTWVNNAGLDGQTTFGHLVLMQDFIVKLRPSVVLFLVGVNDIGMARPWGYDERIQVSFVCFSSLRCFLRTLANHSDLANLLANVLRFMDAAYKGVVHAQLDLASMAHLTIPESRMAQILDEHQTDFIPLYRQRIEKLIRISKENGIKPVFMTHPSLYGSGFDDVTGVDLETIRVGHESNGLLEWRILELYNEALREVTERENVPFIDLAREMPKSSLYYYDYFHFTNQGSEKVAEIVFDGFPRALWDGSP